LATCKKEPAHANLSHGLLVDGFPHVCSFLFGSLLFVFGCGVSPQPERQANVTAADPMPPATHRRDDPTSATSEATERLSDEPGLITFDARGESPAVMVPSLAPLMKLCKRLTEETTLAVGTVPSFSVREDNPTQPVRVSFELIEDRGCDCCATPLNTSLSDDDLGVLRAYPKIESLNLSLTAITDAGLKHIAELTQLTDLNLNGTNVTGRGLEHLVDLPKLQNLQLLGTSIEAGQLEWLARLTSLTCVRLPSEAVDDRTAAILGRLPRLQLLDLSQSRITDDGLARLASLVELRDLSLSDTAITDVGVSHLAGAVHLRTLNLSNSGVTDGGIRHLAHLMDLRQLYLNETVVTDATLECLAEMRDLELLEIEETLIEGFGFRHLGHLSKLTRVALPTIRADACRDLNCLKGCNRFHLTCGGPRDPEVAIVEISDQPNLDTLLLWLESDIRELRLENCPNLSYLIIKSHPPKQGRRIDQLVFSDLPKLGHVEMAELLPAAVHDENALANARSVSVSGATNATLVTAIARSGAIEHLRFNIRDIEGDATVLESIETMPPQPSLVSLSITGTTPRTHCLLHLTRGATSLQSVDLRGVDLTGDDLAPLAECPALREVVLAGICDNGLPLDFLNGLPEVESCLAVGSSIGTLRLDERTGLKSFRFKFGRLGEVDLKGCPRLRTIIFGADAWGYNDHDAKLPRLESKRCTLADLPALEHVKYAPRRQTEEPFERFELTNCPALRSLTLDIEGPILNDDPNWASIDSPLDRLIACRFRNMRLSSDLLAGLEDVGRLREVEMTDCTFPHDGLSWAAEVMQLRTLDLKGSNVSDEMLAPLAGLPHLYRLNLADTMVRGPGFEYLAQCPKLRALDWPSLSLDSFHWINRFHLFDSPSIDVADPIDPESNVRTLEVADQPTWIGVKLNLECEVETIRIVRCPEMKWIHIERKGGQPIGERLELDTLPKLKETTLIGPPVEATIDRTPQLERILYSGVLAPGSTFLNEFADRAHPIDDANARRP
jgi:Leucine-rich repeat (LRR) protein